MATTITTTGAGGCSVRESGARGGHHRHRSASSSSSCRLWLECLHLPPRMSSPSSNWNSSQTSIVGQSLLELGSEFPPAGIHCHCAAQLDVLATAGKAGARVAVTAGSSARPALVLCLISLINCQSEKKANKKQPARAHVHTPPKSNCPSPGSYRSLADVGGNGRLVVFRVVRPVRDRLAKHHSHLLTACVRTLCNRSRQCQEDSQRLGLAKGPFTCFLLPLPTQS